MVNIVWNYKSELYLEIVMRFNLATQHNVLKV